jgi:hypothetical protein
LQLHYQRGKQQSTPEAPGPANPGPPDELLVADARAGMTPADMVERRVLDMLRVAPGTESNVRLGGR